MNLKPLAGCAILWVVNKSGKSVYKKILSLESYYEDIHPWDKAEWAIKNNIIFRGGLLVDSSGNVQSSFFVKVNPRTGLDIEDVTAQRDGTISSRSSHVKTKNAKKTTRPTR